MDMTSFRASHDRIGMASASGAWRRAVARTVLFTFAASLVDAVHLAPLAGGAEPGTAIPDSTPPPTLPEQPPEQLGAEELRELVAPVALYPDVVLASLLPATTVPEQIGEAAAYVGEAEQVETVPEDRGWDGGVVGLLQFPDVLRWLNENPAWTEQMGQAVTYQQGDVLQAIQDYRKAVADAGNLKSNEYQTVRAEPGQDIRIEPARPEVVYVPSYDPVAATQPQPASQGINPWIAFGGGALVGALGAWALYSIFDDDDDDDDQYYGRRGRRIRGYDNYYYHRGRRPRAVAWNPRPGRRARGQNWRNPRRLRYASTAAPKAKVVPLRAPKRRPPDKAVRDASTKRVQPAAKAQRKAQQPKRQRSQSQRKASSKRRQAPAQAQQSKRQQPKKKQGAAKKQNQGKKKGGGKKKQGGKTS